MRYDDFNRCDIEARKMAEILVERGHTCLIAYGGYTPTTPVDSWDERWQKIYYERNIGVSKEFVHFWVICNNFIFDNAAMQFGEPPNLMLNMPDKRYNVYGFETKSRAKIALPNKPEIVWLFREIPA